MGRFKFNRPLFGFVVLLISISLLGVGCRERETTSVPSHMRIISGDNQAGRPGAVAAEPLRVEVLGPYRSGFFGGQGQRLPIAETAVRFEVRTESGIKMQEPTVVTTDRGGYAEVEFYFGHTFGDHYVRASVVEFPHISRTFRLVNGIETMGEGQEATAGNLLPEPLTLTVFQEDGSPAVGIPVFFNIAREPGRGAELTVRQTQTDEQGIATTNLITTSGRTGRYQITAEVAGREEGYFARAITFQAMSLARWQVIIGVLGGLGIFIFGMKIMSDGLRQIAGPKLRSFLHFFTRNRFSAVGAGAVGTAMIQSSSATTVMVVGFVNAGLLTLQQSIGVLLGANIGTTITGQMISLDIQQLALPAVIVGVTGIMVCRRARYRNAFHAMLGFGLLFLGMQMMSSELRNISTLPSFVQVFQLFDCTPGPDGIMPIIPVLGAIAIGTTMTVLVQSSSATIGLTIALSITGLINFYTAVPLIFGENIGTTITGIFASIGANGRARQTAIANTMFNLIGTGYMLILFYVRIDGIPVFLYLVDMLTAGDVFAPVPENIGRHVASAHTMFNIFNVMIFIPLIPSIALVCNFIIPVKKEDELEVVPLEPHLLNTPSIALHQSIAALRTMTEAAWKLAGKSVADFREGSNKQKEALLQQEHSIDEMQRKTIQYLAELTRQRLSEDQADVIPLIIHCVNDAERIGDHAVNIMELTDQLLENKLELSKTADREIEEISHIIDEQAQSLIATLQEKDDDRITTRTITLQGEINQRIRMAEKKHLKRLEKKKCTVTSGIVYTELLGHFERISGHLSNIAERIPGIIPRYWNE